MVGLVIAGPWLTMVGCPAPGPAASRPAALIAARRLADNPQAGFRAVSGLVLALFVTSVAVGVITTIVAERGAPTGDVAATRTLVEDFTQGRTPRATDRSRSPRCRALLRTCRDRGVRGWLAAAHNPVGAEVPSATSCSTGALVSCRELAACRMAAARPARRSAWSSPGSTRPGPPWTRPVAGRPL